MRKKTMFQLRFDGQTHQIDANVLVTSVLNITNILSELNRELDTGKKLEIKINALDYGSFLIDFDIISTIVETAKSLFTKENALMGVALIGGLGSIVELYDRFKGKKPENITSQGDVIIIKDNDFTINVPTFVYNTYINNPKVSEAISYTFSAIDDDSSIEAFEIINEKKEVLTRIPKERFKGMADRREEIKDNQKTETKKCLLNLVKISFESDLKSEFYYIGTKISAKIEDQDFLKQMNNDLRFGKGDLLEVELEILSEFKEDVNTFVNKQYTISKVLRHIPKAEQRKIEEQR